MGARDKLNTAFFWGCLIVSAIAGMLAQSWDVFWATLILSIIACLGAGGIRHQPVPRNHRRS